MFLLLLSPALAGYADVDNTGHPSWQDRALHMYTNMVRVQPDAFKSEYKEGGCNYSSFSSDEKTAKAPYFYSRPLNKVARLHSQDMNSAGVLSHDSSDGTSFGERVGSVYTEGGIGENIAWNYSLSGNVFQGWMCSTSGHRAAIMSSSYAEMGTGLAGAYATQNFGGGSPDTSGRIAMGVHEPESPKAGSSVDFWVDYQGSGGASLELWLDGEPYAMERVYGTNKAGVWGTTASLADTGLDCHPYYFSWTNGDKQGVFPQTGSYLLGKTCGSLWVEGQDTEPVDDSDPIDTGEGQDSGTEDSGTQDSGDDGGDGTGRPGGPFAEPETEGCSSAGGVSGLAGWGLGVLALMGLRRRRRGEPLVLQDPELHP